MPKRSHKRKLRSDQTTSHFNDEVASSTNDVKLQLSERDFEDISNKIENKISKRLRDTEFSQREILRLIENLSSKVDNLSSVTSEHGYLTTRTQNNVNSTEDLEEVDLSRNVGSTRVLTSRNSNFIDVKMLQNNDNVFDSRVQIHHDDGFAPENQKHYHYFVTFSRR